MASNKKDDEIKDAKKRIADGARAVGKAAEGVLRVPMDAKLGKSWEQTINEVDDLDEQFNGIEIEGGNESLVNLRQKYERGDVEVRVMQVGPDGRLTDVSDKVNPKDLRPEHIEGIQVDDGTTMPLSRNPQNREAALRLLSQILPGLRLNTQPKSSTSVSVAKMEAALAESDRILEHWKK